MNIVIIGQNEYENMPKMLESLKKTFPNDKRIWVLDRSTDQSKEYLSANNEKYVCTPKSWEGRRVSSARNFGLAFTDNDSDVLFLDGDRYIVSGSFSPKRVKKDILLFMVQKDERDDPKWFKKYSQIYGHLHNGFYSCGLFMKRKAINEVLKFQGELFDTEIEQFWGVEDVHLGDVCFHLGLTCDINRKMILYGHFDKDKKIPINAWRARVRKRLPLNIIW